jgi:hypothetical protein
MAHRFLSSLAIVCCTALLAFSQSPSGDITGMYSFQRDGEYVQITIDPAPTPETDWTKPQNVSGFISRYGSGETDKDQFLDHFFKSGTLSGNRLRFETRAVHGVSFEFEGKVERGEAKTWAKDGYYVIHGKLTEHATDAKGKLKSRTRDIDLKSYANLDEEPPQPPKPDADKI